ncbi:MAG: peptidoglycan editing factor PgeF [Pseudomonadota bacterium]
MALPLLMSPKLEAVEGLVHGFSTRAGGASQDPYNSLNLGWGTGDSDESVEENYRRLAEALGTSPERIFGVHQVHGALVVEVEAGKDRRGYSSASGDALITAVPDTFLAVRVADCLPILIVDPIRHALGIVHAGWRSTLAKALPATVSVMSRRFQTSPSDLVVALGPGIGACCFEVSGAIAALFEQEIGLEKSEWKENDTSAYMDLTAINARLAQSMGVFPDRIWRSGLCTKCNADRFFSYRRDGRRSGRMVGVIGWSA